MRHHKWQKGKIVKMMRKVCEYLVICAVILLQIVKVSPGTHPVKNHESECRTNESQFKNTSAKLKLLGPSH